MKQWLAIIPVAALIAAVSCNDLPTEEVAVEPKVELSTVEAAMAAKVQPIQQMSTVCGVFRAQLFDAEGQLAERPDDVEIQEAVAMIERVIPFLCD